MKKLFIVFLLASFIGCSDAGHIGEEVTQIDKNYPEFEVPGKATTSHDRAYYTKPSGFILPEEFKVAMREFTVDPKLSTQLKVNSKGTTLHIPENAFVDRNGKPVTGKISISFREYTNPAEIAFSFLPMTYRSDNVEYNFNSAGMFEITGRCGTIPVGIADGKQIKVDYHLVQKTPSMSFFALEKGTNEWKMVQDIPKVMSVQNQAVAMVGDVCFSRERFLLVDSFIWYRGDTIPGALLAVRKVGNKQEQILVVKDKETKGGMKVVGEIRQVKRRIQPQGGKGGNFALNENKKGNATLLGSGGDAGHTYPDIVRGLNVESFGVYNCDQIYRVGQPVNIMASYKDENGNVISDARVLSMIDLKYNGAFSFNPSQFMCSADGKNVLLLFTKTGKLYMLGETEFKKMNISTNGSYAFTMKEVTDKIKGTKDLAGELGIKM